jgi:uncharacterized metal-binding protein YceD (DUF177 family)
VSDIKFSRPLRVDPPPRDALFQEIEANAEERAALAELNELPAIERLAASLRVAKWGRGVQVEGELSARVTRICVVSMEPFEVDIDEPIAVKFLPPDPRKPAGAQETLSLDDPDAPDPLIDGTIDLGALVSEFLTLALDPYPKKPGVEFAGLAESEERESPFSQLHVIAARDEPD